MRDELTIPFPYSPVEHAEALSEGVAGRRLPRRMRLFGLALGTFGVLWAGLEVIGREPLVTVLQNAFPWMALGAFWFCGRPALLKAAVVWELRREGAGTRGGALAPVHWASLFDPPQPSR